MFEKQPGDVFVEGRDGSRAVNVQGLPISAFTALLNAMDRYMGGNSGVRNAGFEDGLGPGAWYVLAPINPEEQIGVSQ